MRGDSLGQESFLVTHSKHEFIMMKQRCIRNVGAWLIYGKGKAGLQI